MVSNPAGINAGQRLYDGFLRSRGGENLVLIKETSTPNPADPSEITLAETQHTCYGLFEEISGEFEGTLLENASGLLTLFRASITPPVKPATGDIIRVSRDGTVTDYKILNTRLDAFEAAYEIQVSELC